MVAAIGLDLAQGSGLSGGNVARAHAVALDVVLAVLGGDVAGQHLQCALVLRAGNVQVQLGDVLAGGVVDSVTRLPQSLRPQSLQPQSLLPQSLQPQRKRQRKKQRKKRWWKKQNRRKRSYQQPVPEQRQQQQHS